MKANIISRNIVNILLFATISQLISACASNTPTEYYTPQISGNLLSTKTNQPISSAQIGLNGSGIGIISTDESGRFTVGPLKWQSHMNIHTKTLKRSHTYLYISAKNFHKKILTICQS